jgi:hypothetical protein
MSDAQLGCGTTRGGDKKYEDGPGPVSPVCSTWAEPVDPLLVPDPDVVSWVTSIDTYRPDVVLSYGSPWDTIDRRIPQSGDEWVRPGVPVYDEYIRSEYSEALSILSRHGAAIAWLETARLNRTSPYNSPDRIDRLNEIVLPLVEALPRSVVIDYQGYLGPTGGTKDVATRDDGVHIRADQMQVVADWLAPQLIAAKQLPAAG